MLYARRTTDHTLLRSHIWIPALATKLRSIWIQLTAEHLRVTSYRLDTGRLACANRLKP